MDGRDVIKIFQVGVDKLSFGASFSALNISLVQYRPGRTMIKIDIDCDTSTDAQIQVYTSAGLLTFGDTLL